MAPHFSEESEASAVENSPALVPIAKSTPIEQSTLLNTPLETIDNLSQLLQRATTTTSGLTFYKPGQVGLEATYVSYFDLLDDATQKARSLSTIEGLTPSTILLLHFDNQHDTVQWFWAATLAGILPAISTPLVNNLTQRKKHIEHLNTLLDRPIVLTAKHLIQEFDGIEGLRLYAIESLQSDNSTPSVPIAGVEKQKEDIAVLMLTSGSTGNAKAVALRHGQIITAVQGKSVFHDIAPGDPFLNWVGMDHVASLTEIHLHAMSLGSDQVHVPATELLKDPLRFVELLDIHKIVYTFAPNFFLAQIIKSLKANPTMTADLSRLRAFIAGAEASIVSTCDALTLEFRRLGVQTEVIRPGFGITEICGGCIYSLACPSYDLTAGLEFANLGTCIPGCEMRVMDLNNKAERAPDGEVGELQVSGPVVFDHYFNNAEATANAFSADGWFITGDLARIDKAGNLILVGRTKDLIVINGIKWSSTDIETAIEEGGIPGLVPTFTVAFAHRAADSPTEELAIVYSPAYASGDDQARFETAAAIAKIVALNTNWQPACIIPLPQQMLEKSSLGKISRSKVRAALEKGEYAIFEKEDMEARNRYEECQRQSLESKTAKLIESILAEILRIPTQDVGLESSIFDLGVNSFNLMLLKAKVQEALKTKIDIPMSVLLAE
ncbi:hypothetical protein ZTR_06996 [Talaromyces verruculosus]|nr:hypothetical protein ZTR_06996 [Talaromyces verruculosus]